MLILLPYYIINYEKELSEIAKNGEMELVWEHLLVKKKNETSGFQYANIRGMSDEDRCALAECEPSLVEEVRKEL